MEAADMDVINQWKITVAEELSKNSKLKMQDIIIIKEWIKQQAHLPAISENQIILFLHASGYRLQDVKKLIENYYTLRTKHTQFFSSRNPQNPHIQHSLAASACVIYGKDYSKRNVMWTKLLNLDAQMYYPTTTTKIMFMVSDIDHLENGTVPGYTMVLDGKGFGLHHATRCSFGNARNIITYVQTASTVVIDKVFIINMTPATEKVMMILKPFIRSELFNKITICPGNSYDELYKTIPKEIIPSNYNGEAPSIEELNKIWTEKLESYKDWFIQEEKLRIKDAKRLSEVPVIKNEPNFGFEGSFKTLAID